MADIIQIRRDTAANWTSVNPILAQGEMGLETDTNKVKFGDGATAWASLGYFGVSSILDAYPVGAIYISVDSTNPGTLFGGTWSAFGAGRVLVGLNGADPDFDTVEETGGAKTVAAAGSNAAEAAHTHLVTSNVAVGSHSIVGVEGDSPVTPTDVLSGADGGEAHSVTNNQVTSGSGSSHNHAFTGSATSVVQPYIVVYMFKRTA